jgi:hypothetical protein
MFELVDVANDRFVGEKALLFIERSRYLVACPGFTTGIGNTEFGVRRSSRAETFRVPAVTSPASILLVRSHLHFHVSTISRKMHRFLSSTLKNRTCVGSPSR